MRAILFLTLLGGAACARRTGAPASGTGTISVTWTGRLRGSFSAPAAARWCPTDTLLEVIAARGDTSLGFSLVARDSVRSEQYTVYPTRNYTAGRPQAGVALRVLGESILMGFEGLGGQIHVNRGPPAVSGTLDVRMLSVGGSDSVHLRGSFERITVAPGGGICGRANKPGGG